MTARAPCDSDQTIRALFHGLTREAVVDNIVQRDAAPCVNRVVQFRSRTQRGDGDLRRVFGARLQILLQPVVRAVDDLVHRIGRGGLVGMIPIMSGQRLGYFGQPFIQLALRAGVQRRKATDDASLTLCNHQCGVRNNEQRRRDGGNAKVVNHLILIRAAWANIGT